MGALAQAREEVEGVFQAGLDLFAVLEEAAHLQVLGDGHVGKDAPALGRDGDAVAHDLRRVQPGDVLAFKADVAGGSARVAADGHQQGGLAGTVAADEGDDLAAVHDKAHVIQRLDGAVEGADAFQLQHGAVAGLARGVVGSHGLTLLPGRP